MSETKTREKQVIVLHILAQDVYQTDSKLYQRTYHRLMKLPIGLLRDLDLLITFKVRESNELAVQVSKILASK